MNDVDGAVYDMGGVQERFGPIPVEAREPVFHHPWEKRVFSSLLMTIAMLGISEDAFRWTMERLPPAQYLAGYYQRWLATLEQMLIDRGRARAGRARRAPRRKATDGPRPRAAGPASPSAVAPRRSHRGGADAALAGPPLPADPGLLHLRKLAPPRFAIGDRVAVSAAPTHRGGPHAASRATRGESAGRSSVTTLRTVLPERSARGEHGAGEHFYTVEFDGRELWGDDAEPGTAVRIDLFESYLEATS